MKDINLLWQFVTVTKWLITLLCVYWGGAIVLATLWCNVLQHKANFPPAEYSYVAHKVASAAGKSQEILELNVEKDGIQFFVDMCTGSLTISGQYVYDWFTANFEQLVANFDQIFAQNWTFSATPVGDLPLRSSGNQQRDEKAGLFNYWCNIKLVTHSWNESCVKRIKLQIHLPLAELWADANYQTLGSWLPTILFYYLTEPCLYLASSVV